MGMGVLTQFHILDSLLCLFIFFPLTLLYWRGAWDLWGVYVHAGRHTGQYNWLLLLISLLTYVGYYVGPCLHDRLQDAGKGLYFAVTRLYICIYAALYVCYWRAVWTLADYVLPGSLLACVVQGLVTYGLLMLCQCSRTCIFPPFYVSLDTRDELLLPVTRFRTKPFSWRYLLDSLFTHLLLLPLAIMTWRAVWGALGALVLPGDPVMSDLACLGAGLVLAALVLLLEAPLAAMCSAVESEGFIYKLLFEDLCYMVVYLVCMLLWRGGWRCTIRYVIPEPELGGWVCLVVGSAGLTLLQLLSYVGARGCVLDGFDMGGPAFFPTHYLRHFLLNDDYSEYGSSKSGMRTPPFPLNTSTLSFHPAVSTPSIYDNLTTSQHFLLTMNKQKHSPSHV